MIDKKLYEIKKLVSLLEEKITEVIKMNEPDLINSSQDFSSSQGENDILGKRQSPPATLKPKCAICGIYKEIHDSLVHEFKNE